MSVLSTYFIWNELLVPLWSRSCERQATRRANFSSGVNNFPNSSTYNPKYHIVEKKLTLMPYVYQGSELIPFLRLPLLNLESQNGRQNKKNG